MGKESDKRKELKEIKESRFKILNRVELNDLKHTDRIIPESYYIVYEKTLLEPKILNYPFKEAYFAKKYVSKYLHNVHTYVCPGQELIDIGFQKPIKRTTSRNYGLQKQNFVTRYGFSNDLSSQRKKSLRTFYRRQLRRRLIKLLNGKK